MIVDETIAYKTCSTCNSNKPLSHYQMKRGRFEARCKSCVREYDKTKGLEKAKERSKKYNAKERVKQRNKERYQKLRLNPIELDKMNARSKRWRENNREKAVALALKNNTKRYHNSPINKLAINTRSYIANCLRVAKGLKTGRTVELLGCELQDLKLHLENLFTEGMSWENYGEWHIDHIKPCASFDLKQESEQKICFHHTNLQPLWAVDNLKKSSNYNGKKHYYNKNEKKIYINEEI